MTNNIVTDVWFCSYRSLAEIASAMGLQQIELDCENEWEWTIGTYEDLKLNVSRNHLQSRTSSLVRIFCEDLQPIPQQQLSKIVQCIQPVSLGTNSMGPMDLQKSRFRYSRSQSMALSRRSARKK